MATRWLGLFLTMLLAGAGLAQQAVLSLDDCLALALQQQTDLQIGRQDLLAAQARVTKAKSGYYPRISLENSTRLAHAGAVAQTDNSTTGLTVSQTFYDGGVREVNIRGAGAGAEQSAAALARTRQTVIFTVTRDYYALLRAQRLAEVQDARVTMLEEEQHQVTTRVQAGDAAPVDLLPIDAQLANARVDRLAARNTVRTAGISLQNTMGLESRTDFAVQDVPAPAPGEMAALDTLTQTALTARPDARQAQAGVLSAKYSVDAAKIALRPRLVMTGDYAQPILSGDDNAMTISGGLVFDLFDGGANKAAYREAQSTRASAALRAAQKGNDIRAEVQTAYLDLQSARDRMAAGVLSVQAAQRNRDAQQERYRLGLAIPLDLLNAQVELVTAQSNEAQARYDYLTALAQLDYAVGAQGESDDNATK